MNSKIPEEAREPLLMKRRMGATYRELAMFLEAEYGVPIHRTNISRWFEQELGSSGLKDVNQSPDSLNDRIKLEQKLIRTINESSYYKKLFKQSIKTNSVTERIVDAIYDATVPLAKQAPIKYTKPSKKTKADTTQIAVAPLTDTHIGEHVDYHQMVGLNAYSMELFNRRLYGWATTILNLIEFKRSSIPIDELIVPMLGDMISGDIHDELIRTNEVNVLEQMQQGAILIAQALLMFAPHFKEINVPCVVGNHGRTKHKPPMKDKYVDWDWMLYKWVSAYCSHQPNIKFQIKKSFIDSFSVFDKNILIMHGDSISGVGSENSIISAIKNLRSVVQYNDSIGPETALAVDATQDYAHLPNKFHSVMIGHFHRVDEKDIGTGNLFICGCMKGGDEFAIQRLGVISQAQQILTYWHPTYGYIGKENIYLNKFDNTESEFSISANPLN